MKLENLNLVELNAQELREIEGGIAGIISRAISFICGYLLLETATNPNSSYNSFNEGYNAGKK